METIKTYKIKAYNTVEDENYIGEFDAKDENQAKQFAKMDFCFPPSSHMHNVKIKSCELVSPSPIPS